MLVKGKMLSLSTDRYGYRRVRLVNNGLGKSYLVHALVAETFIGPRPTPDVHIMHLKAVTKDQCDNSVSNLKYGSKSENMIQCSDEGNNLARKLTDEQIRDIYIRYMNKEESQSSLAREFGVSQTAVWYIVHNKHFSRITKDLKVVDNGKT